METNQSAWTRDARGVGLRGNSRATRREFLRLAGCTSAAALAGAAPEPDETIEMVFRKLPGGKGRFNHWTINGVPYEQSKPFLVRTGHRYRLCFKNQSDDSHPLHLHGHVFELTKVYGQRTAGVMKDTVLIKPGAAIEVDFVANNPGLTLFHCHQQLHLDYGFARLFQYV
jgi:FtsP/CotA-like multicopper oxidase with cupredoxin domain